jgi:3-isopropylmalate/(R)-2-methylmalate dehydratase small subunit
MQAFTRLRGIAAPLPRRNINTDDIYPNHGGAAITDPAAMGPCAFGNWRWNADGSPKPDFILNQPPYDQAEILVAGANFGCGSAREQAPWCMNAIGLRCIIAPSFSDIFHGNCLRNGMLPIRLPETQVDELTALISNPQAATLDVDLGAQTVTRSDGRVLDFDISPRDRQRLLAGVDDIGATLAIMDEVLGFAADYHRRRPWLADAKGAD